MGDLSDLLTMFFFFLILKYKILNNNLYFFRFYKKSSLFIQKFCYSSALFSTYIMIIHNVETEDNLGV